ncbi:hypothetical protein Hanom_Chr14g01265721 [Helianthus anomalus]
MVSLSIQSSPPASPVEEEVEHVEAGKALPVLKWNAPAFRRLMTSLKMPEEHGATYPNDGDTAADAPAGMITLFIDFLGLGNFWLPLAVCMADLLEYYKIHLSQLSALGLVRVQHFEYCFRSQEIKPMVENFRRFYQLQALLGFYSFSLSVLVRLKFF